MICNADMTLDILICGFPIYEYRISLFLLTDWCIQSRCSIAFVTPPPPSYAVWHFFEKGFLIVFCLIHWTTLVVLLWKNCIKLGVILSCVCLWYEAVLSKICCLNSLREKGWNTTALWGVRSHTWPVVTSCVSSFTPPPLCLFPPVSHRA